MKLIIHIGTEKTASTSLQYFFNENRNSLSRNGIHYAECLGHRNHRKLVVASMDNCKTDDWIESRGLGNDRKRTRFSCKVRRLFGKEIMQLPDSINTVLISSEHFHSRLTMPSELKALKEFLNEHFCEIEIVVYFRRQSSLLRSKYTTMLRAGNRNSFKEFYNNELDLEGHYYDYEKLLSLWGKEFGAVNIKVREFNKNKFYAQHICYDFLHTLSPTLSLSDFILPEDQNPSLNRIGLNLLRLLNTVLDKQNVDGTKNATHYFFMSWIIKWFHGGSAKLLTDAAARKFDKRFESSNREVEKNYDINLFR